jgi:hypothetical protein
MIDLLTIGLAHALIAFSLVRLLARGDLDVDPVVAATKEMQDRPPDNTLKLHR